MLQYLGCLSILATEMVICSVIIMPLPQKIRRLILEKIAQVWNESIINFTITFQINLTTIDARLRWFIKFINLIVLGMFVDSAWGVWRSYSFHGTLLLPKRK